MLNPYEKIYLLNLNDRWVRVFVVNTYSRFLYVRTYTFTTKYSLLVITGVQILKAFDFWCENINV
jgi:hypothetical protein